MSRPVKLVYGQVEISLTNRRIRIGRATSLELIIINDPLVSSHHCVIEQSVNHSISASGKDAADERPASQVIYQLIDHSSTNGTLINGVRIPYQRWKTLMIGDVITVGETQLFVREGRPYESTANSPLNAPLNQVINYQSAPPLLSQESKQPSDVKPSILKKNHSQSTDPALQRSINKHRLTRSIHPPSISINQSTNALPTGDKPPPTRLSSPTHQQRSLSAQQSTDRANQSSDQSTNPTISLIPDHFSIDESFDSDSETFDQTINHSRHQSFAQSTDEEKSPERSAAPSIDQTDEINRLKNALRIQSIKQSRLEKKLFDSRRKQSVPAALHPAPAIQQRIAAYESLIDSLRYQILYGDSIKDQQIDCLVDRLHQLNQSTDLKQFNTQILSYNPSLSLSNQLLDRLIAESGSQSESTQPIIPSRKQSNLDVTRDAFDEAIIRSLVEPNNPAVTQPTSQTITIINQTSSQLCNVVKLCEAQSHSIDQLINQADDQSFDQSTSQNALQEIRLINESINQTITQSINQLNQLSNQSNTQPISQPNNATAEQPIKPLIDQTIIQSLEQSINQSINQSVDVKFQAIQQSVQHVWFMMVALLAVSVALAAMR